jgi:hypothetical protein
MREIFRVSTFSTLIADYRNIREKKRISTNSLIFNIFISFYIIFGTFHIITLLNF